MNIAELKEKFSIDGSVEISEKYKDFPFIEINNKYATAVISLYGGQVLSYQKSTAAEMFFLSEKAYYETGKAIKGGVPICWPWFGADPEGKGRPAHGFARNSLWQLESTEQMTNGITKVVICLTSNEKNKVLFANDFKLTLTIIVGDKLELELTTSNLGQQAFNVTQALHTYFAVNNVDEMVVAGLDGNDYLDKAKSNTGAENKKQVGDIAITGEVDRVYLNVPELLQIKQQGETQDISILSKNNKTAVVWNPWQVLCEQSADLKADDYKRFVCVETANAANDVIKVEAGNSYTLHATYSIV